VQHEVEIGEDANTKPLKGLVHSFQLNKRFNRFYKNKSKD